MATSAVLGPRNAPRGTYKPKIVQTAVVAESLRGKSKRAISRALKIHARTVARILKENQVGEYQRVAIAKVDAVLPDAADVLVDEIIVKRDATCAIAALRGRGVLKTDTTNIGIMATNGNVLIGMWPEFAGALPDTAQGEAQKPQDAQSIDAKAVEPTSSE